MNLSKKSILIVFYIGVFFFIFTDVSYAANCQSNTAAVTWTTSGDWTNCGGTTPQTTDTIEILNGHTVTLGADREVAGVQINSGGAITGSTFVLTVTGTGTGVNGLTLNGSWTGSGGAIVNGSGATIDGTASIANTGTITLTNDKTIASTASLTFAGTIALSAATTVTNNGSVTLNEATTTMTGADASTSIWTQGTNSTLVLSGTTSLATGTLTATASGNTVNYGLSGVQTGKVTTYVNLTVSGTSAKTFATTPTVNGIMSLEGTATIVATSGVVTYGASATLQYNTATARNASTEEWLSTFTATGGIIIKNTGVISVISGARTINGGNLTIQSGAALSFTGFSVNLTLHNNLSNSGTLSLASSNSFILAGTNSQSIDSFTILGPVSSTKTAGTATFMGNVNALRLSVSGVGGTLDLGTGLTHTFTQSSNTFSVSNGTVLGNTSTLKTGGTFATSGGGVFTPQSGTVEYTGAAPAVTVASYYGLTLSGSGTATGAVTTVTGPLTLSGSVSWSASAITSTMTSVTMNSSGTLTLGSNLVTSGALTLTQGTLDANNLNVTTSSFSSSNSNTRAVTMGSGTWTLTGTGTVWDVATATNLTVTANTSTIKLLEATGTATAKTFAGGGNTYNNIWFAPATSGSSTGSVTISGSNTFADFKDDNTTAHSILFTANSITTITSLTLDTNSSNLITLASTTPATLWNLVDTAGTNTVSYVSLTDSCASGGATWESTDGTNVNGGNNCGWWGIASPIVLSGTANGNDTATVKVAINGVLDGSHTGTISSSVWSISGVTTPSVGDLVTVWVDGVTDANESTAVTKWASGNISGMVLNTGVVSVGSNQNTSLSTTNMGFYDADDDEDIMHTANSGTLLVQGASNSYTGETLSILASNTLTVTSATPESVTTEKVTNAGTVTSVGSPIYTINGTSGTLFTNSGTFTQATSTVVLSGNGDATVNSGSPTFYNLTSSGTGTKTLGAAITIASSGTLTVSAGVFDPSSYLITGSGSNTLAVSAGATIRVNTSTFAENYSAGFGTINLNATSTVDYRATTGTASEFSTVGLFNDASLVAYYKLEDTADSKGSNTLTNNGTATFSTAKFSNGGDLGTTNTTKSFSRATNLGIAGTGDLSVCFWVKLNTEISSNTWGFMQHSSLTGADQVVKVYYSYNNGTRQLRFYAGGTDTPYAVTLGTVNWHNVCVTRNVSGNEANMYLDGVNVTTSGIGSGTGGENSFYLGADFGTSRSSATYDDTVVFSRVLTPTEIASIYFSKRISAVPTYGNLTVSAASGTPTAILDGAVTATGTVTVSEGTLDTGNYNLTAASVVTSGTSSLTLGSSTINVSGTGSTAWSYTSSAAISAGTSTIKFTDSSSTGKTFAGGGKTYNNLWFAPGSGTGTYTISGNNTFADFKDDGTGAHNINFTASSTTTITSLTLDTTGSSLITLASTTPTTQWNLVDTTGTNTVQYVSITDSCASGGATWTASDASNVNGGNNCGWALPAQAFTISGTANGNNAATVKVAINGVLDGSHTGTIGSSAWTISGITAPSVGDIITVWAYGLTDANETTAVTKYSSGLIVSGMVLNTNVLTIGSNQNTSVSVTDLGLYDADDDEDIMHTSNSGTLLVQGGSNTYTDETLSVLASNTLTVTSASSEAVNTEKLNNAGTITSVGTPTYTLVGTSGTLFTNSGTFTPASSTVTFSGNGDATLNSGSPTFYNLTSSGTGTKALGSGIVISSGGTLTVSNGTFNPATYLVTGSGTNTLAVSSGATINVDASTFAGNYDSGFSTITLNANSTVDYNLAGTQTISNSPTYGNLTISGSGTKTLGGALSTSGTLTLTSGTLDAGNYNISTANFSSSNSNTRAVTMGSGTWTITSTGTVWDMGTVTNMTVSAATSTIKLTDTSSTGKTFDGGGKAFNNIWLAADTSTASYTIIGSNTFADFKDDGTGAHTINFTAGSTTTITTLTLDTDSANLLYLASTTPTSQWNIVDTAGTNTVSYVSITDSCASGGATWTASDGTNTNGDNNCGWVFPVVVVATVEPLVVSRIYGSMLPNINKILNINNKNDLYKVKPNIIFSKNRKIGDRAKDIQDLQKFLNTQGENLVMDGAFGKKTKAALVRFQKAHNLQPDGILGPKTSGVINSLNT